MSGLKFISMAALVVAFVLSVSGPAIAQGAIVRATYGFGNSRVDVTNRVQSLVQPNGRLFFQITNEILGVGDPAPGRVKDLRIQVRQQNGQIKDYQMQEKGYADITVGGMVGGGPGYPNRPPIPGSTRQGDPVETASLPSAHAYDRISAVRFR
jgi:hypothetical protein